MTWRVLDLFSGIGGFSLGLERTGHFKTVGFCEIDGFCRAVLRKHWPDVHQFHDIHQVTGAAVAALCGRVDWITGGFPCQDVSAAGKGAGLAGERSGLFAELHRVIAAVRPAGVLIENVPALRTRGADTVCSSLEAIGYTVWPVVVGAWAVGAPHRRDRVWIVAVGNTDRIDSEGRRAAGLKTEARPAAGRCEGTGMDGAQCDGLEGTARGGPSGAPRHEAAVGSLRALTDEQQREISAALGSRIGVANPERYGGWIGQPWREPQGRIAHCWPSGPGEPQHEWEAPRLIESGVGQPAHGLSRRLAGFRRRNGLKALGNSIVPQVVEAIGRAIIDANLCR